MYNYDDLIKGPFYFGLIRGPDAVFNANDTMVNHPGWEECYNYKGDYRLRMHEIKPGIAEVSFEITSDNVMVSGVLLTSRELKEDKSGVLINHGEQGHKYFTLDQGDTFVFTAYSEE